MPISTASLFNIDKNISWFLNPIRVRIVMATILCLCVWIVLTDVTSDELMRIGIGTFGLSCILMYLHHAATMKNLTKNNTDQNVRSILNSHQLPFDATSAQAPPAEPPSEDADVSDEIVGGELAVSSSSDF